MEQVALAPLSAQHIHNRLYKFGKDGSNISRLLKLTDGKGFLLKEGVLPSYDLAYSTVLGQILDKCDAQAQINVLNRCLIGSGRPELFNFKDMEGSVISMQKRHKSKEDFILNTNAYGTSSDSSAQARSEYNQTTTRYPNIEVACEEKKSYNDEYSIFTYGTLKIGIEVCLDHSKKRLVSAWEQFKTPGLVDVHIVPSCGMTVRPGSVAAHAGGVVFNCDGEVDSFADDGIGGIAGLKSHTTLARVDKPVGDSGGDAALTVIKSGVIVFSSPGDETLFPQAKFDTHIYPPQPITGS
jgi:hypothetical protein